VRIGLQSDFCLAPSTVAAGATTACYKLISNSVALHFRSRTEVLRPLTRIRNSTNTVPVVLDDLALAACYTCTASWTSQDVSRCESVMTNSNSSIGSSGSRGKSDVGRLQRGRASPAVLATSADMCSHKTSHHSVVSHQERSELSDSARILSRTEHIPGNIQYYQRLYLGYYWFCLSL